MLVQLKWLEIQKLAIKLDNQILDSEIWMILKLI